VENAATCNPDNASTRYSATGRAGDIQIDSSSNTFVFPSQVGANVDLSANYRVYAEHADSVSQSTVYDYIFDLGLNTAEATAFCTAFDVSGANAYNSGAHAVQTAYLKSGSQAAVRTIILKALNNAKITGSAQAGVSGAYLDIAGNGAGEAAVDETIDNVLTKVLNHWIYNLADATFDTAYYDVALAGNTGLPNDVQSGDVDLALDNESGNAVLTKASAADRAVDLSFGVINLDAHLLARQIPGSNLTLYADASGNVRRDLLLKGGDKVVLGFQVQMNDSKILTVSHKRGDATNSGQTADTFPANLTVNTLAVDQNIRDITVAVRLGMPGSGALSGVGGKP
jgi:hypothetical protein